MRKANVTFHEKEFTIHDDILFDEPVSSQSANTLSNVTAENEVHTVSSNERKRPHEESDRETRMDIDIKATDTIYGLGDTAASEEIMYPMLADTVPRVPALEMKKLEPSKVFANDSLDKSVSRIEKIITPRDDPHHRTIDPGQKNILLLEKENTRIKQENKQLQSTIQDLRTDQVKNTQEIKSLRAGEQRSQMEREKRSRLHDRGIDRQIEKEIKLREAIQKECDSLRECMKAEKANAVNAIGQWKEALDAERNRVMEGKQHITSLQRLIEEEKARSTANLFEYEKQKRELKDDITKLSQLSGTSSSQLANERHENSRLQEEIDKERSDREKLEHVAQHEARRRADREKDAETLEITVRSLKGERDRLSLRSKDMEAELNEKTQALTDLQEKVNTFRDEMDAQRSQRREVEEQLSKFKLSHQSQYEKLCEYHSEIASLRARHEDLQRESTEAQQHATSRQEALQRELDEAKNRVSGVQHDYEDRLVLLQRFQYEHDATRQMLEDTESKLLQKTTDLTETQELLENERGNWIKERDARMHRETELEDKLCSLADETERQSRALQEVQSDALSNRHELGGLRERNGVLTSEAESLRHAHSVALAELEMAKKTAEQAEGRLNLLSSTISEEREKASSYSQHANDLSDRLRRRELDLNSVKEEARNGREELNSEIFDLRTKLNHFGIEHDSLKLERAGELRERDDEIKLLREEKSQQALQIKNLTHDLHESKLENSKQNATVSAHSLHIENLRGKLTTENDAIERIRQQLHQQQEETDRKEREIETVRYRMQEMEMRHENYQKDLVVELQSAREEANVALTNSNELKHRIINLEDELSEAINGQSRTTEKHFTEIESLRAELQSSQVQTKALEEKLNFTQSEAVRLESGLNETQLSLHEKDTKFEALRAKLEASQQTNREMQSAMDQKYAAHIAETATLDGNLQQAVYDQRTEQRRVNALQKQLTDLEEEIEQQDISFREVEKTQLSKILELRQDLAGAERANQTLKQELTIITEHSKVIQPEAVDSVPRAKYERLKNDFQTVSAQKAEISSALQQAQQDLTAVRPTADAAREAIAFVHRERAAHTASRSDLSKCQAALRTACEFSVKPPLASKEHDHTVLTNSTLPTVTDMFSVNTRPKEHEMTPQKASPAKHRSDEVWSE